MEYHFDLNALMEQCRALYETYPADVSKQLALLDEMDRANPGAYSYTRKGYIYQVAAAHCDVHVFPACPLFGEVVTGRTRNSVTGGFPPQPGIASWLMNQAPGFETEFETWRMPYNDHGIFNGVMFTDAAHHYADCETVLRLGFSGIRAQAAARKPETGREAAFLGGVTTACDSVKAIAENFSRKAAQLLETEQNPGFRNNLTLVRDAAARVPWQPAASFYEALCTIWFTREICNALEGFGFAVLGHLDRLLGPYYEADVANGVLTEQAAKDLLGCFLAMTDARWDLSNLPGGTNAAVIIGGCDADGALVYNDVTRLVLESMIDLPLSNPKIQARMASGHPDEYFTLVGRLAQKATNVLSVFNDDVVIKAHARLGKQLQDCRLYLAGGCQEIVVHNEVNCRAAVYVNLPQVLLAQFAPERWDFLRKDDVFLSPVLSARTFDEFYARYLANYAMMLQGLVHAFNHFEGRWRDYNPCPLFSATMEGSVEKALDVSEGGAVYNQNSFGMSGLGTLVDSLFAVKKLVFEERRFTLAAFAGIVQNDFAGEEVLRQYLLNKLPKYGQDDAGIAAFAARVVKDIPLCFEHLANGHGGYYEASLFSFYSYAALSGQTGATPDGRLAGMPLSRGVNPSETSADIDAATLIYIQQAMDFSNIPGGAVVYMDLPVTKTETDGDVYASLVRYFLASGGGMMDFNIIDREQLLQAQKDPMNHKNIIVRVCGYSAPFYSLSEKMQNEIINRVQR